MVGVQGKGKTPKLAQRTKDGGFKEVQFEDKKKDDSDFHSMVNQMQREKTEVGYEQPSYVSTIPRHVTIMYHCRVILASIYHITSR